MKTTQRLLVVLIFGLLLRAGTAFADDDNQLSGLTAQWWQFMNSISPTVNPLLDTTGVDCMVGQRGPVWFLGGTFFGGSSTRTCSVPQGEWLFFPVINSVQFNTPNICGQAGSFGVAAGRAVAAPLIDAATNLSVQVDGQHVKNVVRVKSEVFATALPADNIYNAVCGGPGTVPAGIYSPSVDDGIYVLLPPLSVGAHTLHFHSESTGGFLLDVTYNLTIVPVVLN